MIMQPCLKVEKLNSRKSIDPAMVKWEVRLHQSFISQIKCMYIIKRHFHQRTATSANIILVLATSSGVVMPAATQPENQQIP